jgi:hypothetical protein|tara:strand:- start:415 stop:600 length:186 start_codon:yes stop_codon:yes gene_type:complete
MVIRKGNMEYDANLVEVLMKPTSNFDNAVCAVMKYYKCSDEEATYMVNQVMSHHDQEARND